MVNGSVELRNLTVGYRQKKELKIIQSDLNTCLTEGTVTALIGPNGAGKSTLLKAISGVAAVLEGSIFLNGKNLASLTPQERSIAVSVVLTDKVEHPFITVGEIIALGRYPHQKFFASNNQSDAIAIENAIELCGLQSFRNRSINELSDGERQRVMVARAIAQDTPILILDEPTAHLDVKNRAEIMLLLRNLARQKNKTIIVATHELAMAMQMVDRVWAMPSKGVFKTGIPEEILKNNVLDAVLSSEQVWFDNRLANIQFVQQHWIQLQLQGSDEQNLFWTEKALSRMGIEIVKDAMYSVVVDNGWMFQNQNFVSLESLVLHLEKLRIEKQIN